MYTIDSMGGRLGAHVRRLIGVGPIGVGPIGRCAHVRQVERGVLIAPRGPACVGPGAHVRGRLSCHVGALLRRGGARGLAGAS